MLERPLHVAYRCHATLVYTFKGCQSFHRCLVQSKAQAKATKRQCAAFREKEAQAMAAKRQCAEFKEKEAQAKATKCQCAAFTEK